MSFFGKLFGKASDKDTVTTGEAIQKLRETEEMLMKKQVRNHHTLPRIFKRQKILTSYIFTGIFREENRPGSCDSEKKC